MKKKILLTESELINMVSNVISEIKKTNYKHYAKMISNIKKSKEVNVILNKINKDVSLTKSDKSKLLKTLSLKHNVNGSSKSEVFEDGAETTGTANTPGVWASGRTFGKTYMNDPKYKWDSGVARGKGNQLK